MASAETEIGIRVKVMLFSVLRERVGMATMEVETATDCTGGVLLDQLAATHLDIRRFREHIRLAVNAGYVSEDVILSDGDEIALITPTSGG